MATLMQVPLHSGFTAAAIAEDVTRGIDLTGRNMIVTGGHSGLGYATTRVLHGAGATVTVAARDTARAAAAVASLPGVQVQQLDLLDPSSIERFAGDWADSGRVLHTLINNAAFQTPTTIVRDTRGYEAQFAANHLGHFALTLALQPALRAAHGARVVTTSSGAQRDTDVLWDDPTFEFRSYDPMLAYAQTKTANVLFTVELDRRWRADQIRAYAPNPGAVVSTSFYTDIDDRLLMARGLLDEAGKPLIDPERGKKTPAQGAATIVFAAVSPLLSDIGGVYLNNCDVAEIDDQVLPQTPADIPGEVAPHSIDPQSAQHLWEISLRLLH